MDQPAFLDDFGYAPDADRARVLDQRVRASLSASFSAIADAFAVNGAADPAPLRAAAARVLSGPVRPLVFALYTDLVLAIQSDDHAGVRAVVDQLAAVDLASGIGFDVINFGAPPLPADAWDVYHDILDDDPEVPLKLRRLDQAEWVEGRAGVDAALALIFETAPAMAGEIAAFANEIVLATAERRTKPPGQPADAVFSSGTSTYLWGAIFLDPIGVSRIGIAEMLVHEAAHCLLTALSNAEQLTANPADERYSSPLRLDPRPMEGIVHAAFVLGRMIMGLDLLSTATTLTAEERAEIADRRAASVLLLLQGVETIRAHGILTPIGAKALAGCLAMSDRLAASATGHEASAEAKAA
jgi:hypothetical protein